MESSSTSVRLRKRTAADSYPPAAIWSAVTASLAIVLAKSAVQLAPLKEETK